MQLSNQRGETQPILKLLPAALQRHGVALLFILTVAYSIYGIYVRIANWEPDTLIVLTHMEQLNLQRLFEPYQTIPGFRPFAYLLMWIEYHLFGPYIPLYF